MKTKIKHIIYVTFLLLLPLGEAGWGLTSCRSPKTVTYSQATTDSVNLSVKDSTNQRFEFTFDSLELWSEFRNPENKELRNSQAQPLPKFLNSSFPNFHHAVIYGGKILSDITRTIVQDSICNKSSTLSKHSVTPCYLSSVIPILLLGLILSVFIIYKLYKDRLS